MDIICTKLRKVLKKKFSCLFSPKKLSLDYQIGSLVRWKDLDIPFVFAPKFHPDESNSMLICGAIEELIQIDTSKIELVNREKLDMEFDTFSFGFNALAFNSLNTDNIMVKTKINTMVYFNLKNYPYEQLGIYKGGYYQKFVINIPKTNFFIFNQNYSYLIIDTTDHETNPLGVKDRALQAKEIKLNDERGFIHLQLKCILL